jgi:ABC-2 type transport system ATP-binding protein
MREDLPVLSNGNGAGEASSGSEILLAQDLHKSYGPRPALRGLSFSMQAGRILGFLGPNGAGKTTAIRILTTMLEPDAGHFVVHGIGSEYPDKIRREIGVLPESLGFPKQITGIEYLTYYGQLYGRTAAQARSHGLALLEEVGLQQRGKSLIGSYSHGMRQRLGIARSLVNDPVVVFLDEPTLGLDPRGQQELLGLVRRTAQERQVGVVLCSHALWEIEVVCDDVVILNVGQVAAAGSVSEVIGGVRTNGVQRNVLRIQVAAPSVAEAQPVLEALPDVMKATPTGEAAGWLRVELAAPCDDASSQDLSVNNRILEALIRADIPILSFEAAGSRLNEVFLSLTEEVVK